MDENINKIHRFEAAGLGKAPYRYEGMTKEIFNTPEGSKSGASCDYCGTAITNCFNLISSDGKKFHVGCECINKSGDKGLIVIAKKEKSKERRIKVEAQYKEAKSNIEVIVRNFRGFLEHKKHPCIPGKTMLDYVSWMLTHAGKSGTIKLNKTLKKEIEDNEKSEKI